MISEPVLWSTQIVHLYCTDTNTVSKWTETRFHMTHTPRSSIGCVQHDFWADGTFDTNRAPFLRQDYHYLQTDSIKLPLEPRHLGVLSGSSETISVPIVHPAQPVHLYCSDTNTISNGPKWDSTWPTHLVSRNRPNYKNKGTKTIAGAIKFPYLSSYNPRSPIKSRGISNQPTYKPRS
jgi:hypothetical protein